jgi:hypothetical protein
MPWDMGASLRGSGLKISPSDRQKWEDLQWKVSPLITCVPNL